MGRALARISELGFQKHTFGVNSGVQFLFITLHYKYKKIWVLGFPKSAVGCPKDTLTPSGLRRGPPVSQRVAINRTMDSIGAQWQIV